MPVDLRGALRTALDVEVPALALERITERAARRLRSLKRRRSRAMLSAAALVALIAVFAGGQETAAFYPAIAAAPAPAPSPLAT
jgi:DNA-binding FadR family transcriptional regulator